MMCALFLRARQMRSKEERRGGQPSRPIRVYARTLSWALRHGGLVMLALLGVLVLNCLSVRRHSERFFFRSRTRASSSAPCRETRASRSRR